MMPHSKVRRGHCLVPLWIGLLILSASAFEVYGQDPGLTPLDPLEVGPTPYQESALRRFEIVTLTALPFAGIHSYLLVRGYRAINAGNFAVGVEGSDWNVVGIGAAALAIGIGVYDYLRMRGRDRSMPLLPEPPTGDLFSTTSGARTSAPVAQLTWRF